MDKRFVIFDMDGTLLDSMGFWRNLDIDYLNSKGIYDTAQYKKDVEGLTMSETVEYMSKHFGIEDTVEDIYRLGREAMARHYIDEVELKEGVREYLDYLRDSGVKMAVATLTAMEMTKPALEKHGIFDYFETVLTCSDLGISKRTPEVFLMAAEEMGSKPHETAVFEDTPGSLMSAVEGGFFTVLVYDETFKEEQEELKEVADRFCVDMNELRLASALDDRSRP